MSTSAIQDFTTAASDVCDFLATARTDSREAAMTVLAQRLARLYAAGCALPEVPTRSDTFPQRVDQLEAMRVAGRWKTRLADVDVYELPDETGQLMEGRLSEDLAHIYSDLREGLIMLESGLPRREATWVWHRGFWRHWGYHVVDILTVLHDVLAEER